MVEDARLLPVGVYEGFLNLLRCAVNAPFALRVCLPAPTVLNPVVFFLPVNLELDALLLVVYFLEEVEDPLFFAVEKDLLDLDLDLEPQEENIRLELEEELDDLNEDREKLEELRKPFASTSVIITGAEIATTIVATARVVEIFLNISPPIGRCILIELLSILAKQVF